MLSQEQIEQIKKQLLLQIENSPIEKKELIKQQIKAMNSDQLEEFLSKNNLMKTQQKGDCIFCSITSREIQSYKIDENKDAVAILEINPISKAHSLVIPKEHLSSVEKIPNPVFSLAKKIAKKIKTKFEPKNVLISSTNLFGHEIINILPVYKNETIASEKHQATPEELQELQKVLEKKSSKVIKKSGVKKIKLKKLWLPKRIP